MLARVGRLDWPLRKLYRSVLVTRSVRREISVRGQPGADALSAAFKGKWIRQVRSERRRRDSSASMRCYGRTA